MWKPDEWPDRHDLASAACMLRDHIEIEAKESDVDDFLEAGYAETMWEPGG
jgi:hypothetical protein